MDANSLDAPAVRSLPASIPLADRARRRAPVVFVLCSIAALAAGLLPPAWAAPPLSDGADGMTCKHIVLATRMDWQQQGGDWVDVDGKAYGDKPYAAEVVPAARGRQIVIWDVTPLARAWQGRAALPGALFLRAVPDTSPGAVNFNSRESEDAAARPELVVEWADGTHTRSSPLADTYLPCSSVSSLGGRPIMQVKSEVNAVVVFPFDSKRRSPVVRAELRLSADKVYGRGTTIGIYSPVLPEGDSGTVQQGIAANFAFDKGIERHPDVLFVDRFEASDWTSNWSIYSRMSTTDIVASDDANGFEQLDAKALKVTVPKGKVLGLTAHYRFAERPEGEPEAMYFRYYLRFGENWNPTLEGGKLPGFVGTYNRAGWGGRKSDGTNGWAAQGSFYRLRQQDSAVNKYRGIGSYVYHADMTNNYGSSWGWNQGPTGLLEKNRWYSIEQYVRMNTPGRNDGVLRAWVDGQLAFEKTDIRYRDIPDLKIESLWMNVYHGGTTPTDRDLTLYIDNLVIARKYIGPFSASR